MNGYAIQCRITTEDPANNFAPDTGTITEYRSAAGFGIRLDGGNGFTGSVISPYYDSLLVKVCSHARSFNDTVNKAVRALTEMRIEGVKTNIGFLLNVLNHPTFRAGNCNTGFINDNPELLNIRAVTNRELQVLEFLGDKYVNETKGHRMDYNVPVVPQVDKSQIPSFRGTKQLLDEKGPKAVADWALNQKKLLLDGYIVPRCTAVTDCHSNENQGFGEDCTGNGHLRKGFLLLRNVGRRDLRRSDAFLGRRSVGKIGNPA